MFIALAWMPKATVQAALCGMPLAKINAVTAADGWKNEAEQEKVRMSESLVAIAAAHLVWCRLDL